MCRRCGLKETKNEKKSSIWVSNTAATKAITATIIDITNVSTATTKSNNKAAPNITPTYKHPCQLERVFKSAC